MMPRLLRSQDRLCYAEIFYAGGTVARDMSSRVLAEDLPPAMECGYAPDHRAVVAWARAIPSSRPWPGPWPPTFPSPVTSRIHEVLGVQPSARPPASFRVA